MCDSEFRELWVSEAKNIAEEFKPEYLSFRNEVNDHFYLNPRDLECYPNICDEAYSAVKRVSPNTKVMVVFSYNHLVDNGQRELFEKFNDKVDVFGLATYPWKHFNAPSDISDDYYSRINRYTNKPIAFTEIGWPSSRSEAEQAKFLIRFLELTRTNNLEMVNWLFLHEVELTGVTRYISDQEASTIALKKADGTRKEIYDVWLDLKELKLAAARDG